jgi:hypothetical protein
MSELYYCLLSLVSIPAPILPGVISGREAPVICGGLPRGYPKVYDQSLFRLAQAFFFFFVDIWVARANHFTTLDFHAAWRASYVFRDKRRWSVLIPDGAHSLYFGCLCLLEVLLVSA